MDIRLQVLSFPYLPYLQLFAELSVLGGKSEKKETFKNLFYNIYKGLVKN